MLVLALSVAHCGTEAEQRQEPQAIETKGGGSSVYMNLDAISVTLAWDANSETDLAGYNMYRATASGGPYSRLNTALIASTSFIDESIAQGETYFYVCTAVNEGGLESEYSNEVSFTVPAAACSGDVNEDTMRDILDVILVLNHISGSNPLIDSALLAADVDGNGTVDLSDAVQLQNHIVGLAVLPPC